MTSVSVCGVGRVMHYQLMDGKEGFHLLSIVSTVEYFLTLKVISVMQNCGNGFTYYITECVVRQVQIESKGQNASNTIKSSPIKSS
jgi:hypothetical protein